MQYLITTGENVPIVHVFKLFLVAHWSLWRASLSCKRERVSCSVLPCHFGFPYVVQGEELEQMAPVWNKKFCYTFVAYPSLNSEAHLISRKYVCLKICLKIQIKKALYVLDLVSCLLCKVRYLKWGKWIALGWNCSLICKRCWDTSLSHRVLDWFWGLPYGGVLPGVNYYSLKLAFHLYQKQKFGLEYAMFAYSP